MNSFKVVILIVMLTIPSIDLVGVDVAITIEDEVFDKDLENKSSVRYKKLEEQVEQEVRKWEWTSSQFLESWNEEELGKVLLGNLCSWEQNLFRLSLHDAKRPVSF